MSEVKNCPKCDGGMEKGFIGAWYIFWSNGKHWVFWRNPPKKDLLVNPGWTAKNLNAQICRKCELVLFNYGHLPSPPSETGEDSLKKCVQCSQKILVASEECPFCGAEQKEKGGRSHE